MNKVFLNGYLSTDPVKKITNTGKELSTFNIAVSDLKNYEDRYFFNCVAWSQQAKYINDNLKKGTFVAVDGRLIKRSYVNSEGKTIYVVEIIVDSIKNYSSVNSTKNKANFEVIDTPIAIDEILNAPDQVLGQEQNNPSNDNEIDNKFDWDEDLN